PPGRNARRVRTGVDIAAGVDNEEAASRPAVTAHAAIVVHTSNEIAQVLGQIAFVERDLPLDYALDKGVEELEILVAGDRHLVPGQLRIADHINGIDLDRVDADLGEEIDDLLRVPDIDAVKHEDRPEPHAMAAERRHAAQRALI